MGIRRSAHLSRLAVSVLCVAAVVACSAAPHGTQAALAATPVLQKLDVAFPPEYKYAFNWFAESGGRIVYSLGPGTGSSPCQLWSWTPMEGLTSLGSASSGLPAIDGNVVVWLDGGAVRGVDLSTATTFVLADGASPYQADVSGDWVVWDEGLHAICAHNIATGETRTLSTSTTGLRQSPRVCGDYVVWMDDRAELGYDIWGYRLSTGEEFPVCTASGWQTVPETDGRYVVWNDERTLPSRVYARDMSGTDSEFEVEPDAGSARQGSAHIGAGLVTWGSDAVGGNPAGLYARKLPSGVPFFVSRDANSVVPDGDRIYYRKDTDVWCANLMPIAGSLKVHSFTGTTGYTSATTVELDVVADSDEGPITGMDFGGGWEPFTTTRTIGPLADGWHTITAKAHDDAGNQAQILSQPFYVDTVAPVTTWSLTLPHSTGVLRPGWFSTDVVLHLGVLDASGVGTVHSQTGDGAWLRGGPLRFDARADHSLDGWYTVHFYSKDAAGNVEVTPQTVEFGIDTAAPTTAAAAPVVTRPGQVATVRFIVRDGAPAARFARARVVVLNRLGRCVLKLAPATVRLGEPVARRFVCRLRPGRYRFLVRAVDGAGNRSVRQAAARLVVR